MDHSEYHEALLKQFTTPCSEGIRDLIYYVHIIFSFAYFPLHLLFPSSLTCSLKPLVTHKQNVALSLTQG